MRCEDGEWSTSRRGTLFCYRSDREGFAAMIRFRPDNEEQPEMNIWTPHSEILEEPKVKQRVYSGEFYVYSPLSVPDNPNTPVEVKVVTIKARPRVI
jgi:hypothetical protein